MIPMKQGRSVRIVTQLHLALDSNGEIHIGHMAKVDHQWKLNNHEKQTLRNRIASGNLPTGL
jgi:hypothetical protein